MPILKRRKTRVVQPMRRLCLLDNSCEVLNGFGEEGALHAIFATRYEWLEGLAGLNPLSLSINPAIAQIETRL